LARIHCGRVKSFKDPVHGYCDLCDSVASMVDVWVVQRLRWIRQTAFANLVYHGMEHSRFNHSLGVAHLAREVLSFVAGNTRLYYSHAPGMDLAEALLNSVEMFQLASLIHDIGHLPFSHASEAGILEARSVFEVEGFERVPPRHEEYTYSLIPLVASIAEDYGIEPVFTSSVADDLSLILRGVSGGKGISVFATSWCVTSILNRLLAGGLDIDRVDYLLRDSIYAGVRYGVFDADRLIRVILATPMEIEYREDNGGGYSIGVSPEYSCSIAVMDKGLSIVESFLLARFYMHREVYQHRVVEAYNSLYARLFGLMARDGIISVGDETGSSTIAIPLPVDLERMRRDALDLWARLDDIEVLNVLRSIVHGVLGAGEDTRLLAEMLLGRRHPRVVSVIEDRRLWSAYRAVLQGARVAGNVDELLRDVVEFQRENPLVIVRPLETDVVSFGQVNMFYRKEGRIKPLGQGPESSRVAKLAELGLWRVAVYAVKGYEGKAEKVVDLLSEAKRELGSVERS